MFRRYALLALLFALAATYQVKYLAVQVHTIRHRDALPRPPVRLAPASNVIAFGGRASGIHRGDLLIAVNGRPFRGLADLEEQVAEARVGDAIQLTIQPPGQPQKTVGIQLTAPPPQPLGGVRGIAFRLFTDIVIPVVCIAFGFYVAAVRPAEPQAWILLVLMLGFSQARPGEFAHWHGALLDFGLIWHNLLSTFWPAAMLLFGFYFPERFAFERRHGWLKWLIIVPAVLLSLADTLVLIGTYSDYDALQPLARLLMPFQRRFISPFFMGAGIVAIACLGAKLRLAPHPDARRRVRLLLLGISVSMGPMAVLTLIGMARSSGGGFRPMFPGWVMLPILLLFSLCPVVLAYVILVHRAIDVRMAIRQGLQYSLARHGLTLLNLLIASAIVAAGASLLTRERAEGVWNLVVIGCGLAMIVGVRRVGAGLARSIDRRFFREAYNAEQILSDLSDQVRSFVETAPLLETVLRRISESLHVTRLAVLLCENGACRPAFSLGFARGPEVSFSGSDPTLAELRRTAGPVLLYFDDPERRGQPDLAKLQQLDAQLLLPLAGKDRLLGFISLGPKQSEEPYSSSDLRLLRAVVVQTGLALENSQLAAAIAAEVAQRERLNREVEIAREVQERLFPQTLPPIPGLDYYGVCRPALGVGGDYYDFLALPADRLGIAVGDVSGKGIAAALLMASLQASLRSQAAHGAADVARLMENINRLVGEASSSNRFATLFYGQYDPAARSLTYVNAGHNAPLLLHDGQLRRLDTGGIIVGAFPDTRYRQDVVTLETGDLLVAFTDGVIEAQNARGDEFGEERIAEFARGCAALGARGLAERILAAVDEFAAGAPQYDDITLVVLRATAPGASSP